MKKIVSLIIISLLIGSANAQLFTQNKKKIVINKAQFTLIKEKIESAKDFTDLPDCFEIYAGVNLDILSIKDTTDFITGKETSIWYKNGRIPSETVFKTIKTYTYRGVEITLNNEANRSKICNVCIDTSYKYSYEDQLKKEMTEYRILFEIEPGKYIPYYELRHMNSLLRGSEPPIETGYSLIEDWFWKANLILQRDFYKYVESQKNKPLN